MMFNNIRCPASEKEESPAVIQTGDGLVESQSCEKKDLMFCHSKLNMSQQVYFLPEDSP